MDAGDPSGIVAVRSQRHEVRMGIWLAFSYGGGDFRHHPDRLWAWTSSAIWPRLSAMDQVIGVKGPGSSARISRNASEAAINYGLVRQTITAKGRRFFSAPTRSFRDALDVVNDPCGLGFEYFYGFLGGDTDQCLDEMIRIDHSGQRLRPGFRSCPIERENSRTRVTPL
jgi:hypothetical protein